MTVLHLRRKVRLRCFSLFSGIGGFDLALQRTNHEIVGACEIDKYARQIYSKHFPGVPLWEDATKIQPEELPDFEMLCGGFPCQPFSVAGKRFGFEESRGQIFFEIARIARQKRPKLLLLENVPGILSHNEFRTFATVLNTLHEMGYDLEWQSFNSKYFVPQGRERIFIIGHLREKPTPKIFPLRELPGLLNEQSQEKTNIANSITTKSDRGDSTFLVIPTMIRQTNMNGRRSKNPNEETFTLDTSDSSGIIVQDRLRQFTPLEYERLQGFPDGWTEGISDTQRKKCCGNAVTVPLVEYILKRFERCNN